MSLKTFEFKHAFVLLKEKLKGRDVKGEIRLLTAELQYKPKDLGGWSLVKRIRVEDIQNFTRKDAEAFAKDAESRLRV
ncbi:MAG: hypothetical protein ACPGUD_13080 [Parashewanella sp.]